LVHWELAWMPPKRKAELIPPYVWVAPDMLVRHANFHKSQNFNSA
jgi:hypothetical protein